MDRYKVISVRTQDETQHYVVEAWVTEDQIRAGEIQGVICLAFGEDRAEKVARLLSNHSNGGGQA